MIDTLTPVTFLAPGPSTSTDRYGKPVPGPDVPTVVDGCIVFQTATAETPSVLGDQAITSLTILVPYGTDVGYLQRARIGTDPRLYQVLGTPTQYRNPFTGWAAGGVVYVRLVEG